VIAAPGWHREVARARLTYLGGLFVCLLIGLLQGLIGCAAAYVLIHFGVIR